MGEICKLRREEFIVKAIVLLSGGLDSATCLSIAISKYNNSNVTTISVFYGQKHKKELQSAKAISDFYGVNHYVLDLAQIFSCSQCSLMSNSPRDIEHKSYSEQLKEKGKVDTYVPFRNGLMLSAVASFAGSIFEDEEVEIFIGAHADDAAGNAYADCSQEFVNAINKAIYIGTYNKIKIVAPFIGLSKAEVVRQGLVLGTPYKLTWSCYEGGEKPCGECGTCIDRANAFKINGITDPALES